MSEVEIWRLYDKNMNFVCNFTRGAGKIPDGLYHKTVEVIPTDMEGNLLLTRRSLRKRFGGGTLEFPAGSVISTESEVEAACRELKEETGLTAVKLFFVQKARMKGMIRYTYIAYIPDMKKCNISYPKEEVMGYRFVTFDQWMELLTTDEFNSLRTSCYNQRLYDSVKKVVMRHADEADQEEAPKPYHEMPVSSGLATKKPRHLDLRCYDDSDDYPNLPDNWEPTIEEGDDKT